MNRQANLFSSTPEAAPLDLCRLIVTLSHEDIELIAYWDKNDYGHEYVERVGIFREEDDDGNEADLFGVLFDARILLRVRTHNRLEEGVDSCCGLDRVDTMSLDDVLDSAVQDGCTPDKPYWVLGVDTRTN